MFMETPITKICCGPKSATVVKPSKMQKKKKKMVVLQYQYIEGNHTQKKTGEKKNGQAKNWKIG